MHDAKGREKDQFDQMYNKDRARLESLIACAGLSVQFKVVFRYRTFPSKLKEVSLVKSEFHVFPFRMYSVDM